MVVAGTGQLEDRRAPTTTLEGWRSLVNADRPSWPCCPASSGRP
jgi:hypothetical protein